MNSHIFDGHNDALSRLWSNSRDPVTDFARSVGHVNVPDCKAGGMGGGFFALYSPATRDPFDFAHFDPAMFDSPLPPALEQPWALASVVAQLGIAQQLQAAGHLTIAANAADLARAFTSDRLACLLHLEGADAIGEELLELEVLYAMGVRSIGPVWSRPTIFGEGVPFGMGRDGDTGPGLTEAGKRLVVRCAELGMIVDTSHITMKGFWDVAEAGLPLVATHSNAYEVCRSTRNLTDDQLRAVGQTGGVVGLNFATVFLDETAWQTGRCAVDACIRNLSHMIEVAGEDHVAIGSDFDGAPLPDGLGSAAALDNLRNAMNEAGFGAGLIAKLCNENWLSFLGQHLR
ncbi:MAG: dipeptidase [Paracoccaceae bacterium]